MPIFIKSAIPGLTNRTAVILQVGLLAVVGALTAMPRDDPTAPAARRAPLPAPTAVAAPPAPQEANLAFSTIEVVVNRNDTMDRLFRRFELNLSDLASLRNLPELRSQAATPGAAVAQRVVPAIERLDKRCAHTDGQNQCSDEPPSSHSFRV